MKLPIDIPALLRAATDIEGARKAPLSVSVYIDPTADEVVAGHVRQSFASAGPRTRVAISYLCDDALTCPYDGDDMAVLVAGELADIGEQARVIREAGVPVMVVTSLPASVAKTAAEANCPIPDGDLVSSDARDLKARKGLRILQKDTDGQEPAEIVLRKGAEDGTCDDGFNEELAALLDARMGEWVIAVCKEKKLAFALSFPFVRRPLSMDAVNATALQNAAIGALPIIPGADLPVMTLNQAKMILQIAAAYGQPISAERVKEIACVVGGGLVCRNVARTAAGVVPVLGWAVKGAVGFTGTEAMGRAAVEYFEAGGDIVGAASVVQKARDEAIEVAQAASETPTGRKVVDAVKQMGSNAVRSVVGQSAKA